jgi:hypothetical protein
MGRPILVGHTDWIAIGGLAASLYCPTFRPP